MKVYGLFRFSLSCMILLCMIMVASVVSRQALQAQDAPAAAPNQNYGVCFSDPDQPVVYFSAIFAAEMPSAGGPRGRGPGNGGAQRNATIAIQNAWLSFLQKKYGYKSASNYPVGCAVTYMPTAAGLGAAQNRKAQMEDKYRQAKQQVIETGWKNQ